MYWNICNKSKLCDGSQHSTAKHSFHFHAARVVQCATKILSKSRIEWIVLKYSQCVWINIHRLRRYFRHSHQQWQQQLCRFSTYKYCVHTALPCHAIKLNVKKVVHIFSHDCPSIDTYTINSFSYYCLPKRFLLLGYKSMRNTPHVCSAHHSHTHTHTQKKKFNKRIEAVDVCHSFAPAVGLF